MPRQYGWMRSARSESPPSVEASPCYRRGGLRACMSVRRAGPSPRPAGEDGRRHGPPRRAPVRFRCSAATHGIAEAVPLREQAARVPRRSRSGGAGRCGPSIVLRGPDADRSRSSSPDYSAPRFATLTGLTSGGGGASPLPSGERIPGTLRPL